MENPDHDLCLETELTQQFSKSLKLEGDLQEDHMKVEEIEALVDEEEDDDEEEFSFMCGGEDGTFISAEDCFINGQIKASFPFFNQDSLFHNSDSDSDSSPMMQSVKTVLVEMDEDSCAGVTSSPLGDDEITGSCCEWSNRKAVEVSPPPQGCKKCNSTGFSKIWRFKEFIRRSNSDGRDTFVFLHNGRSQATAETQSAKDSTVVLMDAKLKKSEKSKTASLSSHEVYLRSKGKAEQRRRRSYLPYRPELMGFFTNVNVGLTKNVHPF